VSLTIAAQTNRRPAAALSVIGRILHEGFAGGNDAVADELCSPDLVEHQFGLAATGARAVENLKRAMRSLHASVPDVTFTIEDSVEAGDTIWVRARATGTASGPLLGPPSGLPVDITVIDVARVVDGRIVEHWGVPDRFALLTQTGVLSRLSRPS
jgi:predicted ester cyclase